jgi:hypothetical protein
MHPETPAISRLALGKTQLLQRMLAAGWPKQIGLNDKRLTSHNRWSLNGSSVDTFFTKGHGFFIYA